MIFVGVLRAAPASRTLYIYRSRLELTTMHVLARIRAPRANPKCPFIFLHEPRTKKTKLKIERTEGERNTQLSGYVGRGTASRVTIGRLRFSPAACARQPIKCALGSPLPRPASRENRQLTNTDPIRHDCECLSYFTRALLAGRFR